MEATEEKRSIGRYSGGDLLKGIDINGSYQEMILSNQEIYLEDYLETVRRVADSNAKYKGKPVPFLFNPLFFSPEEEEHFKEIVEGITAIGNKVTDRFIADPEYRKSFGYPSFIEEMILRENKYGVHAPIGRFDIFFNDIGDYKFCELNTDGSSAMNEDNTLARILLESNALKAFSEGYSLANRELIDSWVYESLKLYRRWKGSDHTPNTAIVDFTESGTSAEFIEFQKAYERLGLSCIIADPRELEFRDGALYRDDYKIDLVYRRIVTFELIQKANEIPHFIEAYMADAMCTVGTIRSQIIHNKIFFKKLHDEDTLEFMTKPEKAFIKKHIPFTGILGNDEKILRDVIENKDKYIIKPMDMNASQGVYVGKDQSNESWERVVRDSFDRDYLYQEFVDPPKRSFLVANEGGFSIEEFKAIVGLFSYNESYAGIYTRLSKDNIISGVTNYFTAPNIIAYKK